MEQGYIILPRNLFSADIWQQKRVFSEAEAWIDIIASVRYVHGTCTTKVNGKSVSYTHGEWPASLRFLAKRWQWTVRHVRTFLEKLIACNLVTVRKCGAQNIICVIGYGSTCSGTDSDISSDTNSDTNSDTDSDTVSDIESGTISDRGTSHEETPFGTPSDTLGGTKKNKDINIFINDNNAHAYESIQQEINEMNANQSWQEAICMRYHITPTQLTEYLELFAVDCMCCGKERHHSQTDAFSHFNHWLRIQLQNTSSAISSNYSSNIHHYASRQCQPSSADLIRDAQQWAISQSQRLIRKTKSRHGHLQETFPV